MNFWLRNVGIYLNELFVANVVWRSLLDVGEQGLGAALLHHDAAAVLEAVALHVASQVKVLGLVNAS